MTDNEIIKSLECCKTLQDCCRCPYLPLNSKKQTFGCSCELMGDVLDLINRQRADIKMLNGFVDDLKELCKTKIVLLTDANWDLTTVKAKTLKEFAERFKQSCGRVKTEGKGMLVCQESSFDYLVEKMMEE